MLDIPVTCSMLKFSGKNFRSSGRVLLGVFGVGVAVSDSLECLLGSLSCPSPLAANERGKLVI